MVPATFWKYAVSDAVKSAVCDSRKDTTTVGMLVLIAGNASMCMCVLFHEVKYTLFQAGEHSQTSTKQLHFQDATKGTIATNAALK